MNPIIVVHGVGNQERGATLSGLARTFGRVLPGGTGTELRAEPDVLVQPPDEPSGGQDEPPDPAKLGAYYPHVTLEWRDANGTYSLPMYEFYWADESRIGESIWNEARSYWQILLGLPRLGLYAIEGPAGSRPGRLDRLAQGVYVAAWTAIVPPFLISLVMAVFGLSGRSDAVRMLYDPLARTDAVRTSIDLLLVPVFLLWYLLARRGRARESRTSIATALIALTAATLLTDLVTLGLRYSPFHLIPFPKIVAWLTRGAVPNLAESRPLILEGNDPIWYYTFNTLPGVTRVIGYALILVWAAAGGIRATIWYVSRGTRRPSDTAGARKAAGQLDIQLAWTTRWWLGIGAVLIVIYPLIFQVGWWFSAPDWLTLLQYDPNPHDAEQFQESRDFLYYDMAIRLTLGPFALVSFVLLTFPSIRSSMVPALELALDVLNYLPPRPVLDARAVSRFLLGGRRSSRDPSLEVILRARLRELIELTRRRHGGPVQVIAHSHGSIIALSALDDWRGGDRPAGPDIDLVTMGCPLMLLAQRLPNKYGTARPDGGHRRLELLGRWRNLYFSQDVIGRNLDPAIASPDTTGPAPLFLSDIPLGDGTHTEYFGDPRVVRQILLRDQSLQSAGYIQQ